LGSRSRDTKSCRNLRRRTCAPARRQADADSTYNTVIRRRGQQTLDCLVGRAPVALDLRPQPADASLETREALRIAPRPGFRSEFGERVPGLVGLRFVEWNHDTLPCRMTSGPLLSDEREGNDALGVTASHESGRSAGWASTASSIWCMTPSADWTRLVSAGDYRPSPSVARPGPAVRAARDPPATVRPSSRARASGASGWC
jgi:hypothetical protein